MFRRSFLSMDQGNGGGDERGVGSRIKFKVEYATRKILEIGKFFVGVFRLFIFHYYGHKINVDENYY